MGHVREIKEAFPLLAKIDSLEVQRKLLAILPVSLEIAEENQVLKAKINQLQEKLIVREHLTFANNVYWAHTDECTEGPFCSVCWDARHKLVNLHSHSGRTYVCPNCQVVVDKLTN